MKNIKIQNSYKQGCFYVTEHFADYLEGTEGIAKYIRNFAPYSINCYLGKDGKWYRLAESSIYGDTVYYARMTELPESAEIWVWDNNLGREIKI